MHPPTKSPVLSLPDSASVKNLRSPVDHTIMAGKRCNSGRSLPAPPEHQWVHPLRQLDQAGPSGGVERGGWVADDLASDDAAFAHQGFGRPQAALLVLVVDQGQM